MKEKLLLLIACIIILITWVIILIGHDSNSSPVEDINRKQLVYIVDSIIDARISAYNHNKDSINMNNCSFPLCE